MNRAGESIAYHADGLGSIVTLTRMDGTVAQSYVYDSFGCIKVFNNSGVEISPDQGIVNPYTYTAREFDPETGLYYYRARYYDPGSGRFMSEDPIGFGGRDVNLFRYVKNNSINFTDPSGKIAPCIGANLGEILFLNIDLGQLRQQLQAIESQIRALNECSDSLSSLNRQKRQLLRQISAIEREIEIRSDVRNLPDICFPDTSVSTPPEA